MTRRIAGGLATVAVTLAVLVVARVQALLAFDRRVDVHAHALVRGHHWLLSAARVLTHLGDPVVVDVGAVLVAVALVLAGQRFAGAYVAIARVGALALDELVKAAVRRHRPALAHPVAHATGFSFPSGHSLGSAAFYGSLAVVARARTPRIVVWAVAVGVPAVVAATRVLLGVHYPSDVVAGAALGWLVAVCTQPAMRLALAWRASRR